MPCRKPEQVVGRVRLTGAIKPGRGGSRRGIEDRAGQEDRAPARLALARAAAALINGRWATRAAGRRPCDRLDAKPTVYVYITPTAFCERATNSDLEMSPDTICSTRKPPQHRLFIPAERSMSHRNNTTRDT
ncbi:hypothetical protein EVAR_56890_1 [Eumeta japonica]|uniref:Uncharacterized protein n=1 Tax=Eumeta variegata TaxID=151549 RepID=A0A4C1ZMG5_EUMVA|nr:hypothetical protein EVAR_56890_1 [Eumeta japonica]